MREIEVTFSSGRDVLNAYWGFLSNGGLVLSDDHGLSEGEPVTLAVTIESQRQRYRLAGQVVRRPQLARKGAVIAFDPGEPHDLLLSAAWAETDNVPARRHRRFPVDAPVRFRGREGEQSATLVNLSFGGCCLRSVGTKNVPLRTGDEIAILGEGVEIPGRVRWTRGAEAGVEFTEPDEAEARVRALVQRLR